MTLPRIDRISPTAPEWAAIEAQQPAGICDSARVIEWAQSTQRPPASVAFTAGPERQAAYWIEWAQRHQAARIDIEAMLTACVPGGSSCDPQQVADAIRGWVAQQPSPAPAEGDCTPWSKTVESAALLLNRATDLPLDDCERLAGTILGMASDVHPEAADGDVVVTWDQDRTRILAVTRQDDEGRILSVIAEAPAQPQPKVMANGLTEAETAQMASVFGLTQDPAPSRPKVIRQAFEAWYSRRYGYDFSQATQATWKHASMCDAWEVWQAAAPSSAPAHGSALLTALRAAEASLTEMQRDGRAWPVDVRALESVRAAIASPAVAHFWRPIGEAPKDGAEVWAFNGEQARMKWIEGEGYALWVWADTLLSDTDPMPEQPTHFMLLPANPVFNVPVQKTGEKP